MAIGAHRSGSGGSDRALRGSSPALVRQRRDATAL